MMNIAHVNCERQGVAQVMEQGIGWCAMAMTAGVMRRSESPAVRGRPIWLDRVNCYLRKWLKSGARVGLPHIGLD